MQAQLIDRMKSLRLHGMASALEESLTALSQKKLAPTSWLGQLLEAEHADRQARSFQYQMRLARFPVLKDLDSFDFRESLLNETAVRQLFTGQYADSTACRATIPRDAGPAFHGMPGHRSTVSRAG